MLKRFAVLAVVLSLALFPAMAAAGSATDYFNQANKMWWDFDEQLELYNKVIELSPNWPAAYNNRGVVYFNLAQWDNAIADFTKAIELKPDYKLAIANRAGANFNKKEAAQEVWDGSYQDRVEAGF